MNGYKSIVEFRIVDTNRDGYLGYSWLKAVNPRIDWATHRVWVRCSRTGELIQITRGRSKRHISLRHLNAISSRACSKILQKTKSIGHLLFCRRRDEKRLPLSASNDERLADAASDDQTRPETIPVVDHPLLQGTIKKYASVFRSEFPETVPPQRSVEYLIDTGSAEPVNVNAYPLSPEKLKEQVRQVRGLLDKGLIRESDSPWGFPTVFVKKSSGEWRMCVDYRPLNVLTTRNAYPLPRIDECLARIGSARVLSKLDLLQGFYQVSMEQGSVPKTAFNTRDGKYEFLAMPFGLKNAPATFQGLMNRIFRDLSDSVIVYLDDILIYSNSLEEHQKHLEQVLERLESNGLYAKPSKCEIGKKSLEFVGHLVGNGKVQPAPAKVDAIRDWPIPTTAHEIRQFLGLASYYRNHVKGFANIAAPLSDLLKESDAELRAAKHRSIVWNVFSQHAFEELKRILTSHPVLYQGDPFEPYLIETDSSEWAIGFSLLQKDKNGRVRPLEYGGRKLQGAELNYPIHEKELLAIKEALRIYGERIQNGYVTTILTDHESLKYLEFTRHPSKRLARWVSEFAEHDIKIEYRPGKGCVVPDAISRRPDWMEKISATSAFISSLRGVNEEDWVDAVMKYLRDGLEPQDAKLRKRVVTPEIQDEYRVDTISGESTLFRTFEDGEAPYLSAEFRADFLEKMHGNYGHLSYPGLEGVCRLRAWWPSQPTDIKEFAKHCPRCQMASRPRFGQETEVLQTLADAKIRPFERWAIDLIGILPVTPRGNRWIVTAVDYATGWPVARALEDSTAKTIAEFFYHDIYLNYGPPRELLSDNGTSFLNETIRHYLELLGTKHRTTTPYHPRTNGKVESLNGSIGRMLTKYLIGRPTALWDEFLGQALFACRVRAHATSRYSPYYLLYGQHPRLVEDENPPRPLDLDTDEDFLQQRLENARTAQQQANTRLYEQAMKAGRVRAEITKPHELEVGDSVLVRNEAHKKFQPT